MFANAFRRATVSFTKQQTKRNFGHAAKVRPATRPSDFEGFMRYYLVEDYHVVFFVLGSWFTVAMLGKTVAALFSSPKPKAIAHGKKHGGHDDHHHHHKHAHGHATSGDAIPSDIDAFLAWMDAEPGNLDKALATI